MSNARLLAAIAVAGCLALVRSPCRAEPADGPEFFEKKVRPVLVEHCFKCHADQEVKAPKGGLRLDSRAGLLRGGDNGPAVVPGEPDKSRLIEAIRYQNADLQMPPKGKLPDATIADLAAWVKSGAIWPDDGGSAATRAGTFDVAKRKREHWAWHPVRKYDPPPVKDSAWGSGAVDRFILAKLEAKGIKPARPAERRVWLRRVTFDLIGLPPAPAEVEAYLADTSPNAERTVVDRLLASPHFGERWGRHWLDLVRYAETRGHEFDAPIPNAFQYRDYVIRALNADVPYDRFVREHVAGDLLADPRRHPTERFDESILGTGFWFLNEEVHSPVDIRQDQADRFDNRIDVLTKAFLGLTVSCARCHDHKFDAIGTRDYYALFGFVESSGYRQVRFDSCDQNRDIAAALAELNRRSSAAVAAALSRVAKPATEQLADYLLAARDAIRTGPEFGPDGPTEGFRSRIADIARERKLEAGRLTGWIENVARAGRNPADPFHIWAKLASVDSKLVREILDKATAANSLPSGTEIVVDFARSEPNDWLPDDASFGPGPVRPGRLRCDSDGRVTFVDYAAAEYDRAWDLLTVPAGTENDPGAIGKRLRAGRTIRTPTFKVTAGKLHYFVRGGGMAYAAVDAHSFIQGPLHGQLVKEFPVAGGFRWVTQDLTPYKGHHVHVEFTPAKDADFAVAMVVQSESVPPAPSAAPLIATDKVKGLRDLAEAYEREVSERVSRLKDGPPATAEDARLANALLIQFSRATELEAATSDFMSDRERMVARVWAGSRLAPAIWDANGVDEHVFIRGSPKGLGELVPRRFLEALTGTAPIDAGRGSGRLELARQMTDPRKNPFIARVMVNRVWHHLFGRGLVASVDNFGVLGEPPTHPELLDFLADRFVREGWSVKTLVRDLVLSSTYRMATQGDTEAAKADPQNLLVHKSRLKRLEGEAIRDAMLAVSGRLDRAPFGAPVPIYLTPFLDGRGRPASGPLDGNGRRSVYLAVRRNFLSPMLLAFDTPIPFSTIGRRQVSNVPAQALILLNDPFVHQQAATWAKSVLAAPGTASERVDGMYRSAFGRAAKADELSACLEFLKDQAARYGTSADDAKPWADLAHTLFNTKEFIYLD